MLNNLKPNEGSRKASKRRCRGLGSGLGKNGGSGNKGQNSRSGGGVRLGFEGGQLPYFRRFPKRGFRSIDHKEFSIVNVSTLNDHFKDGDEVNLEKLISLNLVDGKLNTLKVLGNGELNKKLTVKANGFSSSAKEKIEKAGGNIEII